MDRYVLVVYFNQKEEHEPTDDLKPLEPVKQIFDRLSYISCQQSTRAVSVFPACSLSGSPSVQKWYLAIQACQGAAQFCSSEWEELEADPQKNDSEDASPNVMESCLRSLSDQEGQEHDDEQPTLTELFEEAAEGLHQLSDKLPAPGKALLDVLVLGCTENSPGLKDLLPLMGALKHMACWHAAKTSVITQHANGWQKVASYLSANVVEPVEMDSCINPREVWRGGLLIREKKCVSELQFDGFSLCSTDGPGLLQTPNNTADHKLHSEVFHYYRPVLDLVQLVSLSELPSFMPSSTHFTLGLSCKSLKAKMLLDQLRSLRGKVGGLFCLSCVVTPIAPPPASQLSSQRWKEFLARRPKSLPVPEVEVKGESAHYFLLVQGSEVAGGDGACRVTMLHSAKQINGAAAMATVTGLLQEKSLPSGRNTGDRLCSSLPCLSGKDLLKREKKITQVQSLAVKEYLRRRAEASSPATIPVNDLKVLLNLAREQYLKMNHASLAAAAPRLRDVLDSTTNTPTKTSELKSISSQQSDWPERSVLHNIENLQRRRQQKRVGLSGPGSSDSLLGPKDGQKSSFALLDAKELLKHFTPDGNPAGELQPLLVQRGGDNAFQLSAELTPGKVSRLPFSQASASRYHGIEFCLDEQRALDRDRGMVRLQSRLIRYETQTTCSKEPCSVVPWALSPAPSPAVLSEPGSVPDGEMLQNADVARLKRMSWDAPDVPGGQSRKRLAKSESSDSLGSQSSSSSGPPHPCVKSLRQQPLRTQSASSLSSSSASVTKRTSSGLVNPSTADKPRPPQQKTSQALTAEEKLAKESRSQKHHRMLKEVVAKTLKHHGITSEHKCFNVCSQKLFEISKFYLKDLKTSRGLHEEMKKAASINAKQVIDWELEKASK